jgi:hypothetical protein
VPTRSAGHVALEELDADVEETGIEPELWILDGGQQDGGDRGEVRDEVEQAGE